MSTHMTSDTRGLFISFEGIDGAGKSSHIGPLASAFEAQGRRVTVTREPGGTALAEQLRGLLLNESMDPLTEAMLAFAARRDHICRVIAPALERGDVVLCDRFTDATFAYQGAGRGFSVATLSVLESMVQTDVLSHVGGLLEPNLTFWFDLDPAVAAQRLAGAREPDRFEQLDTEFFSRVASGYAMRAKFAEHRFVRVQADRPQSVVGQQVIKALIQRRWLAPSDLPKDFG